MAFWTGWALWQKLSFVLACVLILVLAYSFCVLAYNKRALKKHAAAEARRQSEQDAEAYPMLTEQHEVPFGAKALQKGVHVEGIWAPKCDVPARRDDVNSQAISTGEVQRPLQAHKAAEPRSKHQSKRNAKSTGGDPTQNQRSESSDYEDAPEDQPFKRPSKDDDRSSKRATVGSNRPLSGLLGQRSSWISKPFEGLKRFSRPEGKLSRVYYIHGNAD
ncbi:hypothetical protein HFD88_006708 [Aspergillus terreus]|nr:hypothetical protein HFD88_006708 [Aspergillus terreus]